MPKYDSGLPLHEDPYSYNLIGFWVFGYDRKAAGGCSEIVVLIKKSSGFGGSGKFNKVYRLDTGTFYGLDNGLKIGFYDILFISPLILEDLNDSVPSVSGENVLGIVR